MKPIMKPFIGVSIDWEAGSKLNKASYSSYPFYALRQSYCDSLARCGGIPWMLPYHIDCVDDYLGCLHGLVITGGDFDVNPFLFGAKERHESVHTKEARTAFEWALIQKALEKDMPILGICGGHQLLNVVLGGTLIQHIPDSIPNCLQHETLNSPVEVTHRVSVTSGTKLSQIVEGKIDFQVNTSHHQAIDTLGSGVVVNAVASDGVIEGIEVSKKNSFCLGVQWHPEFLRREEDFLLFKAFIQACCTYLNFSKKS